MLNCIVIDFKKKEANINDVHLSFVGILGLEPRMTGPESVVLPLHHIPILMCRNLLSHCVCKGTNNFLIAKCFRRFFCKCMRFSLKKCNKLAISTYFSRYSDI